MVSGPIDHSSDSGAPSQDPKIGNIPSLKFYDGKEESGSVGLIAHMRHIG
jgi:hypothetical protein